MGFLPANLSSQLKAAGQSQIDTGNNLKTSATKIKAANASLNANGQILQTITALQTGATATRPILATISTALSFVANALRAIVIPTINPSYTNVAGFQVITGLGLGNLRPFTTSATRFDTMSTNVSTIRDTLQTIAASLAALGKNIPTIQLNINDSADILSNAGDSMSASGNSLITASNL